MSAHAAGPWKVVPCPIHAGKHPCHDARWIMTADTEVEMSDYVPDDWRLTQGSIVCQMRDRDPRDAHLIAAAPELLAAIERLIHPAADDSDVEFAREVIAKARGGGK